MRFEEIAQYSLINDVNEDKVNEIAESIKVNGFVGCPILVASEQLITGSHRLAALKLLDMQGYDLSNMYVAEDVTDLVNDAFEKFNEKNEYYPDLDLSDIGWMFNGTWVEEYKDQIEEW